MSVAGAMRVGIPNGAQRSEGPRKPRLIVIFLRSLRDPSLLSG